ncbi:hypothetical protein PIB30_078559, partial [Stylosanthes scabra]|nr:hypothetical protein [Stylosanthes scabra]
MSVDWLTRMDCLSGEDLPFHTPFQLSFEGWFDVVGIENVPVEANCHSQLLLLREDHLCLAASTHYENGYASAIFQLDFVNGTMTWSHLWSYGGLGDPYRTFVIIDEELIQ